MRGRDEVWPNIVSVDHPKVDVVAERLNQIAHVAIRIPRIESFSPNRAAVFRPWFGENEGRQVGLNDNEREVGFSAVRSFR